jgi:DNA-binding MarR family transcriptional regulator
MTKQTMNHLLVSLEQHGYLERVPDPRDGRSKVIHLTDRGRALIRVGERVAVRLEQDWADVAGASRLNDLQAMLASLMAVWETRAPGVAHQSESSPAARSRTSATHDAAGEEAQVLQD